MVSIRPLRLLHLVDTHDASGKVVRLNADSFALAHRAFVCSQGMLGAQVASPMPEQAHLGNIIASNIHLGELLNSCTSARHVCPCGLRVIATMCDSPQAHVRGAVIHGRRTAGAVLFLHSLRAFVKSSFSFLCNAVTALHRQAIVRMEAASLGVVLVGPRSGPADSASDAA